MSVTWRTVWTGRVPDRTVMRYQPADQPLRQLEPQGPVHVMELRVEGGHPGRAPWSGRARRPFDAPSAGLHGPGRRRRWPPRRRRSGGPRSVRSLASARCLGRPIPGTPTARSMARSAVADSNTSSGNWNVVRSLPLAVAAAVSNLNAHVGLECLVRARHRHAAVDRHRVHRGRGEALRGHEGDRPTMLLEASGDLRLDGDVVGGVGDAVLIERDLDPRVRRNAGP